MAKKTDEKTIEPLATRVIIPDEYMKMSGKTICVIHMFSVALQLALKNTVLYVSDDEEMIARFQKYVINNAAFGNDDRALFVKTATGWQSEKLYDNMENFLKMNKKKKFDCCIMNPPWGRLGWVIAFAAWQRTKGHVVCLNSNNVQHTLSRFDEKSYFQKYKGMFGCREKETTFSPTQVAALFPSKDKKEKTHDVRSTSQVSLCTFGHAFVEPQPTNFEQKLIAHLKKHPAPYLNAIGSGYAVYIPALNLDAKDHFVLKTHMIVCQPKDGKMVCCYDRYLVPPKTKKHKTFLGKPWYDCYQKNEHTKTTNTLTQGIAFSTLNEAKNFVDSQACTFMRWANRICLSDMNVSIKNLLCMTDYTQPWTNQRFCEYFGITGYIDDEHAVPGSEWETILNTMKDYV